jgi:hypothetical protein
LVAASGNPAAGVAQAADPEAVAEVVSEALEELEKTLGPAGQPITVKPDETTAPENQAQVAGEVSGVSRLDAGAAGEAELSLDQPAGEVAVLVTDALVTDEFSIAGVTWEGDQAPGRVLARAYQKDVWTEWFDLDQADGPDPASAEGRRAKGGTDPLVVAGSTAIQIQVLSEPGQSLPEQVAPAVVPLDADETGSQPAAAATTASASPAAGAATAQAYPLAEVPEGNRTASGVSKPTIKARSAWNAAPADYSGNTPKGQPELAAKLSGAIIHHQEGSNTYTEAQVPGIIRSIQSWHMGNNGWDDIGYNFLVDKYGGIWEGRQGGIDKNVVGAHAFEFNTGSTGVCFLGSMETAEPTAAALDAAGRLVAWRLGLAGFSTLKGTTVYPKDTKKQAKPIVAGHRDVNATTCPGRYLYAKLDVIRSYVPSVRHVAEQTLLSPDMTGNGRGEVLSVDQRGDLLRYSMQTEDSLAPPVQIGSGWTKYTAMAPGDWDGDGTQDLMAVTPSGDLQYYPGKSSGYGAPVKIGHGWTGYIARPAGDLDGDGALDLLGIKLSTYQLFLYRGDGKGGFISGAGRLVGDGWRGYQLHAAGDLDGDGRADIISIDPNGWLYTYRSRAGGGFETRKLAGSGWGGYDLFAGADLTGDGRGDITSLHRSSRVLSLYTGKGNGRFAGSKVLARDW